MMIFRILIALIIFWPLILAATKPNFVIIFTDDQGYQDLGCFGSPDIATPNLDRMAAEGTRFTSFYAQTICGPSRTALLASSYPLRVAQDQNRCEIHPVVHSEEHPEKLAELLKLAEWARQDIGDYNRIGQNARFFDQAPNRLKTTPSPPANKGDTD